MRHNYTFTNGTDTETPLYFSIERSAMTPAKIYFEHVDTGSFCLIIHDGYHLGFKDEVDFKNTYLSFDSWDDVMCVALWYEEWMAGSEI